MSIVAFMDLAKGLIFNRIKISLWRCSIYSAIRVICKKHGNRVGYKSIKKKSIL
jgi:cell division protein FtsL